MTIQTPFLVIDIVISYPLMTRRRQKKPRLLLQLGSVKLLQLDTHPYYRQLHLTLDASNVVPQLPLINPFGLCSSTFLHKRNKNSSTSDSDKHNHNSSVSNSDEHNQNSYVSDSNKHNKQMYIFASENLIMRMTLNFYVWSDKLNASEKIITLIKAIPMEKSMI